MFDTERRFARCEYRQTDKGVVVHGVAMPYNEDADIAGMFTERFLPGAFGDVTHADVVANVQHDRGRPLARTGSSGGLVLEDGPIARRAAVLLPDTTEGRDTAVLVRRGVLAGFSIEFRIEKDGESWQGDSLRVISRAELRGIAIVDRPAYDAATAEVAKRARQAHTPKKSTTQPLRQRLLL